MPLEAPKLDRRTYREILNEALARIPVHNPEYTHFNDSDPGVTLLQLFAFMSESILYRANLIPERNRRAFLRLLGLPLRPAQPARGLVAFSQPRGTFDPVVLAAEEEVLAGQVPFRTTHGLEVLPLEARLYTKAALPDDRKSEVTETYRRVFASLEEADTELDFYETTAVELPSRGVTLPVLDFSDTIDGSLWLALLAPAKEDPDDVREAIAGHTLTLGVLPALDEDKVVLSPGGTAAGDRQPGLVVEMPDLAASTAPRYRRLELRGDSDLLREPGVGEIDLPGADELDYWDDLGPLIDGTGDYPPSLADTDDATRLVTWLRLRVPEASSSSSGGGGDTGTSSSSQHGARVSWVGWNVAEMVQETRVVAELLPQGTGEPDQESTLAHTPVLAKSLRLTVNGDAWQRIDDLATAVPEVQLRSPRLAAGSTAAESGATAGGGPPVESQVFTLDPEAGTVRFGDGAHGARPPRGTVLQASYAYGGGRQGMVGIGTVTKAPNLPSGVKVTNPVPTWGGDEAETVTEGERRVPGFLKHRDRLISEDDILEVTRGTPGVDLGRVEVLPLFHPDLEEGSAPGVVTILVVPRHDALQPDAPRPDRLFLETVCLHLEPRRLLTTELHVRGPVYVSVWISIGLEVVPGRAQGPVRQAVEKAVRSFLSPLEGGFDGKGWPLRTEVAEKELLAVAARVTDVKRVDKVLLGNAQGGNNVASIALEGLELPRVAALAVQVGEPTPLAEARGQVGGADGGDSDGGGTGQTPKKRVAAPVIPDEC